jgi:hypothetical protein
MGMKLGLINLGAGLDSPTATSLYVHKLGGALNTSRHSLRESDMGNRMKELGRQLGMPYGTAVYRLLRLIIFRFAVETRKDFCFRCNEKISQQEFSIEHKQPWLHVSPDLFWHNDNIAFSHRKCNSGAARKINKGRPQLRKAGPEGTSWCTEHKLFLPVEQFSVNKRIWNGLQRQCVPCRKKRNKKYKAMFE